MSSFATPLSGLTASTDALDIVGNNLANLNTTGYKESAAYFRDLVSESLGAGQTQLGFGVSSPLTIRQFTQGAIQSSSVRSWRSSCGRVPGRRVAPNAASVALRRRCVRINSYASLASVSSPIVTTLDCINSRIFT